MYAKTKTNIEPLQTMGGTSTSFVCDQPAQTDLLVLSR